MPAPQDPPEAPDEPAPWAAGPPLPALPPPGLAPAFQGLLAPARYKAVHGGRGSGKSHAFAELLVRRCIGAAPVRAVCIREVQRSLDQSVKRLVEDKIRGAGLGPPFPGAGRPHPVGHAGRPHHLPGHEPAYPPSGAHQVAGRLRYIAWVEGGCSSARSRSWTSCSPTLRKPGRGFCVLVEPDARVSDLVDRRCSRRRAPPPGADCFQANWTCEPRFPEVLQDEMEVRGARRTGHGIALGWRIIAALVLEALRAQELAAGSARRALADACFRLGADWGFARDPTVLLALLRRQASAACRLRGLSSRCVIDPHAGPPVRHRAGVRGRYHHHRRQQLPGQDYGPMQRHGFGKIGQGQGDAQSVEEGSSSWAHDILGCIRAAGT